MSGALAQLNMQVDPGREPPRTVTASAPDAPWPYLHAPKGSCRPGCKRFGYCHCSPRCERQTKAATHNHGPYIAGLPYVFSAGHNRRKGAPPASRNGLDVEAVRVILRGMVRLSSRPEVARRLGIPLGTVDSMLYNSGRKMVGPKILELLGREAVADAAVLIRLLDACSRRYGSLDNASEIYADRFETTPQAAVRMFFRLRKGDVPITEEVLDRLCVILDRHLDTERAAV